MPLVGQPGIINTAPWNEIYRGMIPNLVNKTLRYCANENTASESIPIGTVVGYDPANDRKVIISKSVNTRIRGIAVDNGQRIYNVINGNMCYRIGDPVSILEEGDVVMYAESNVRSGDQVYYRYAPDGTKTNLSAVAGVGGTGLAPLLGGRFVQTVKAGSLVWIQFRITLPQV
jgi:hypothetical protein